MILTLKSSKAGWFLSVLYCPATQSQSGSVVCCPLGRDRGGGISFFLEALYCCLEDKRVARKNTVRVQKKGQFGRVMSTVALRKDRGSCAKLVILMTNPLEATLRPLLQPKVTMVVCPLRMGFIGIWSNGRDDYCSGRVNIATSPCSTAILNIRLNYFTISFF